MQVVREACLKFIADSLDKGADVAGSDWQAIMHGPFVAFLKLWFTSLTFNLTTEQRQERWQEAVIGLYAALKLFSYEEASVFAKAISIAHGLVSQVEENKASQKDTDADESPTVH